MASSGCSSFLLLLLLLLTGVLADDADTTTMMIISEGEVKEVGQEVIENDRAGEMRDQAVDMGRDKKSQKNATHSISSFMPSIHFGPIALDQQRQPTKLSPFNVGPLLFPDEYKNTPFNGVSAIKFGDNKENLPLKAPTPSPLAKTPFRPSEEDVNLQVKFIDDKHRSTEDCATAQKISTNIQRQGEPIYHQHLSYQTEVSPTHSQATSGYTDESYNSGNHQQQYVNYEIKPVKYDTTSLLYPTPYQQAIAVQPQPAHQHQPYHHHNEATIMKPEMIINVQHPMSFQAASYDSIQKPKTVIYVSHEPHHHHQFHHQPPVYNHLDSFEHDDTYPVYYDQPHYKSLSPWKKILHIIGAFLPLGLLFALLPNVIRPNTNPNNNPSIVLSKLRVNDLQQTSEHKSDRPALTLDTDCREERSICRLLSAADNAGFDFLRNLVVQIAEKTAEPSVRKKELDRIFEASKLGNCDILTCNFYDGT